jgi:hypothetical protein
MFQVFRLHLPCDHKLFHLFHRPSLMFLTGLGTSKHHLNLGMAQERSQGPVVNA